MTAQKPKATNPPHPFLLQMIQMVRTLKENRSSALVVSYLRAVLRNEKGLGHFVRGPEAVSVVKPHVDNGRHTDQQMAVLGIVVTILGLRPLKKPLQPSRRLMILAASHRPLTFRSSASAADPRVCSRVLITSSGVVTPAASPPASPPAVQCVYGSHRPVGFIVLDSDS